MASINTILSSLTYSVCALASYTSLHFTLYAMAMLIIRSWIVHLTPICCFLFPLLLKVPGSWSWIKLVLGCIKLPTKKLPDVYNNLLQSMHAELFIYKAIISVCVWRHSVTHATKLYSCTWRGPFRLKPPSCSMKFEHLPSVNLVWHDLKLQHSSSDIVGGEESFRLNVVCPLRIPPTSTATLFRDMSKNALCGPAVSCSGSV